MKKPTEPPKFAEGTSVSVEKTQTEIRALLKQHGAQAVSVSEDERARFAGVMFTLRNRTVRMTFTLPSPEQFQRTRGGVTRTETQRRATCDAELRRKWRGLLLRIKGRLEVIASNDATVDEEFLAYLVLTDGATVGDHVLPQLDGADATGRSVPRTLPAQGGRP